MVFLHSMLRCWLRKKTATADLLIPDLECLHVSVDETTPGCGSAYKNRLPFKIRCYSFPESQWQKMARGQVSRWAAFTLQGTVLYFLHIHFVLCSKNKCKLCLLKSEIHFNISDMILGAVIFVYVALILLSSKILKFLILNFFFLTSVIFLNLSPF